METKLHAYMFMGIPPPPNKYVAHKLSLVGG